jgi:bis(5'-nucleosidyl)-tetraphosphatase
MKMRQETSYGIIPLQKNSEGWEVFLVQHQSGHWAFPKGHKESGETDIETATRELKEETGLDIKKFFTSITFRERYAFTHEGEEIDKTVVYYAAEVEGEVLLQEDEIAHGGWFSFTEARDLITYSEAQRICDEVRAFLGAITQI